MSLPVEDPVSGHRRRMSDGFCDVAFSGPRRSDQDGVFIVLNELQGHQLKAGLLGDSGVKPPVKFGKRLFLSKPRLLEPPLHQAGFPAIHLVLQQQREGVQKRQVPLIGLKGAGLQRRPDPRETEYS